jgi:hypothetical protein
VKQYLTRAVAITTMGLIATLLSPCSASAQSHPDDSVYRYRVRDYALQAPWHSYPDRTERAQWQCFNDATKLVVDCDVATEPLQGFRYIFQRDLGKLRHLKQVPGGLY